MYCRVLFYIHDMFVISPCSLSLRLMVRLWVRFGGSIPYLLVQEHWAGDALVEAWLESFSPIVEVQESGGATEASKTDLNHSQIVQEQEWNGAEATEEVRQAVWHVNAP